NEENVCGIDCLSIQRQLRQIFRQALEGSLETFTVQCYGPFLNQAALLSDEVKMLIAYGTPKTDINIIGSLKFCQSISEIHDLKDGSIGFNFSCMVREREY